MVSCILSSNQCSNSMRPSAEPSATAIGRSYCRSPSAKNVQPSVITEPSVIDRLYCLLPNLLHFSSSIGFLSLLQLTISHIMCLIWACLELFFAYFLSNALIWNNLLVPHSAILQKVLLLTEPSAFVRTYCISTAFGRLLLSSAWQ